MLDAGLGSPPGIVPDAPPEGLLLLPLDLLLYFNC